MNFQTIGTDLNKIAEHFQSLHWDPSAQQKTEKKFIRHLSVALSQCGQTILRQALITFRPGEYKENLYQFACKFNFRELRDFIAKNQLLPEAALGRPFYLIEDGVCDLSCAVIYNDLEFVRDRLFAGADVNTCTSQNSLLGIAASLGHIEITELIMSFNPSIHLLAPMAKLGCKEFEMGEKDAARRYQTACILIKGGVALYGYKFRRSDQKNDDVDLEEAVQPKLRRLVCKVKEIRAKVFSKFPLLVLGQNDSKSSFYQIPDDLIWKIMDAAYNTLVVGWAEEEIEAVKRTHTAYSE